MISAHIYRLVQAPRTGSFDRGGGSLVVPSSKINDQLLGACPAKPTASHVFRMSLTGSLCAKIKRYSQRLIKSKGNDNNPQIFNKKPEGIASNECPKKLTPISSIDARTLTILVDLLII